MTRSWIGISAGEGLLRTSGRSVQKLLGGFSKTVPGNVLTTFISNGVVNMTIGFIGARKSKQKIFAPTNLILGSLAIGTVAVFMGFLSLRAFVYEGSDIGVVTFIVALSIIPGAILDRIFFAKDPKTHLNSRQLLAMAIYVLAGWSVLNFPSIGALLNLPIWVLISFLIALLFAVNEILKRKVGSSKLNPFVMNYWTGLITIVICSLWLIFIGGWNVLEGLSSRFWIWSIVLGTIAFGGLALGMLSYKPWAGGTVARKKVVMWGVYLSTAMIVGVLLYKETLTIGKGLGVLGFLLAFVLMDQETWVAVKKALSYRKEKRE
jgi:uncharacterized membrane protein